MLSSRRVRTIAARLRKNHENTNLHNRADPLEEAIFILLSGQTDEAKYLKSWEAFVSKFPTMDSAARARKQSIERAIKEGGLSSWKAVRIKRLLRYVKKRFGRYSLKDLDTLSDVDMERELVKLDGIGIKSARCIMMYSFGRKVFPVDTHVLRICTRLGFHLDGKSPRTRKLADSLQNQVPPELRHRLHINMVQHGRYICRPTPKCEKCCLRQLCEQDVLGWAGGQQLAVGNCRAEPLLPKVRRRRGSATSQWRNR